ncbi:hypothetical protein CDL12_08128 [Handroanthus impetiginosus]|uniref:Uncharacterized protein n=1 Tax=Handroanthus impetiginosus TaxID=429701 RepID=A0A2G9HNW4_9LAMI|nr:hypothetical protein CDL12_08128 [Handroanthus impetiginosus]
MGWATNHDDVFQQRKKKKWIKQTSDEPINESGIGASRDSLNQDLVAKLAAKDSEISELQQVIFLQWVRLTELRNYVRETQTYQTPIL